MTHHAGQQSVLQVLHMVYRVFHHLTRWLSWNRPVTYICCRYSIRFWETSMQVNRTVRRGLRTEIPRFAFSSFPPSSDVQTITGKLLAGNNPILSIQISTWCAGHECFRWQKLIFKLFTSELQYNIDYGGVESNNTLQKGINIYARLITRLTILA